MKRLKFGFRNQSASQTLLICERTAQNLATLPPEHLVETQHEKLGNMVAEARASHERVALLRMQLKEEISRRSTLLKATRDQTMRSAGMAAINMNNDPVKMGAIGLPLHSEKAPVGLPAATENLQAVPTDSEGEARLRWKRPVRECSFQIQFQAEPLHDDGWKSAESISLRQSYLVKGLMSGGKYWFRVRASNAHGQGPWSGLATARVK